jgi:hypothetical protein
MGTGWSWLSRRNGEHGPYGWNVLRSLLSRSIHLSLPAYRIAYAGYSLTPEWASATTIRD